MFLSHKHAVYMDLSTDLQDPNDWVIGSLRTFEYPLNITALAIEPISCLLAVGTAGGVVYIFGGPGVETRLTLPEPRGVKFLQFATSTFKLVCLDDSSQLHIWDLSTYGRPKFVISVRFDKTNFLTLSPSHTHAFLALNSGEIKTYDLTCLRKSSYTIPNMWKLYEEKMLSNGLPDMTGPESRVPVETTIHPRNLNLLFVAYAGGVILSDLTQRNTVRTFELVLPPGTPGGYGYDSPDLLTARRPPVTALAIHPTGHFFAVGHADGCIAFWATEDEDQPLLVRTLETIDVNVVDTQKLDEHLFKGQEHKVPHNEREPIFKLSWSGYQNSSDPRGGETTLTVLGGLDSEGAPGLSVLHLPAFNPPEPPAETSPHSQTLRPFWRTAMRNSLEPLKKFFYCTQNVVQDYLLIPQQSPYFSGTFNPIALLLLAESQGDTRTIEAYQFPPSEFTVINETTTTTSPTSEDGPIDSLADDLAATLKSLQITREPQRLRLPTALMNGNTGLVGGQLLKVDRETYEILTKGNPSGTDDPCLSLKGGVAWSDDTKSNDFKLSKYQPNRLLITYHLDQCVRFHNISAQLLIGLRPTPIQNDFPNPLVELTVDLKPILMDPSVLKQTSPTFFDHARIESVHFASESLEIAIIFNTGELAVFRMADSKNVPHHREADDELIILEHASKDQNVRFSPYFMLLPGRGAVSACAISDIGFIAVSYLDSSLFVIDMRVPKVILRHVGNKPVISKKTTALHLNRSEPIDPVTSLAWTVSALEKDHHPQIRLLAVHESGLCHVYTISRVPNSPAWYCDGPIVAEGATNPLSMGSFVIDSKSGDRWRANRARLAASESNRFVDNAASHSIFVSCGTKGARCFAKINGERISKVDWGSKMGTVQLVQIMEKLGSHVLVLLNERHEVFVYSLPYLEYLHCFKLPELLPTQHTVDETGDYIAWTPHPTSGTIHQATYCTMFDIRRTYDLPDIDLLCTKPVVPPQPQPVSMGPASLLGSWFTFSQSITGEQVDILLGGPDRPLPEPQPQSKNATGDTLASSVSGIAATAAAAQSGLYNRLTSALNERGQLLGDLEQRFNALEEGSRGMVAQAKRLAAQQTAKSWFGI